MQQGICLDTGPIYLNYAINPPTKIEKLFENIKKKNVEAYIVTPVLAEVYKHLCVSKDKNFAQSSINNIYERYPINIVNINKSLTIKAGYLKCSYRKKLSYVDCFVIAYGLIEGMPIHTTEKNFPDIHKLKVITYSF